MYRLLFLLTIFLIPNFSQAQEERRKPVAQNWESTYYHSYFSKYYYGYYHGYGATEVGLTAGIQGWQLDVRSWIRDQYGAGLAYSDRYKGEKGLSFLFAYGIIPNLQVIVGPMMRFIPATEEESKKIKFGFEIDGTYYFFKDFGLKIGYNSTANFNAGVSVRVNNLIFDR